MDPRCVTVLEGVGVEQGGQGDTMRGSLGLGIASLLTSTRMKAAAPSQLPLLAVFGIGTGCDFLSSFQLCETYLLPVSFCIFDVVPPFP